MVEPREDAEAGQRKDAGSQVFSTRYTTSSAGPSDRRTVDLAYRRRPRRRRLRRPLILAGLLFLFGAGVWVSRDTGPGTPGADAPPAVPAATAPDPEPTPAPAEPPQAAQAPPPETSPETPPETSLPQTPAPAGPAAQPAPGPPSPAAPATGGMRLQLGSYKSEAAARAGMDRLRSRFAEPLAGFDLSVVRADLGARGVFYRVIAGPADSDRAGAACVALKAQKVGCLPVRP